MITNNDEKLNKALERALELLEQGKSISEISDLMPEFEKDLREFSQIIELITQETKSVTPPKELLNKIISQIAANESVTNKGLNRYMSYIGEIKGRSSIFQLLKIIKTLSMNKIYIGAGIFMIILLVVVGGAYRKTQKPTVSSIESEAINEQGAFEQDSAELAWLDTDGSIENLNQDLSYISEEDGFESPPPSLNNKTVKKIETTSMENLESEMALELDGFSNDSTDLDGYNNDNSLNGVESELSTVAS